MLVISKLHQGPIKKVYDNLKVGSCPNDDNFVHFFLVRFCVVK